MKKIVVFVAIFALFIGCNRSPKFTVEGTIADAAGEMIFLEQVTDSLIRTLDSLEIGSDGRYKFRAEQPKFAEFYRLRMGDRNILFAIDSCETISINSQRKAFATDYRVENSEVSADIRTLRNSGFELQQIVDQSLTSKSWDNDSIVAKIDAHKAMAQQIIMKKTRSLAAYYAVNQQVNGVNLFLPTNRHDRSFWGAVGTAFKVFEPENPRGKRIEKIILGAVQPHLPEAELVGAIDIELPNRHGENVKLSSLKGKVVLLDFSAQSLENANLHTLFLRELWEKYQADGFEIFQISLDENKLFWLERTRELPWICVRDKQAPNCRYLLHYNVQSIPAWFLVDRNGDIVAGTDLNAENLQQSIERQLRK